MKFPLLLRPESCCCKVLRVSAPAGRKYINVHEKRERWHLEDNSCLSLLLKPPNDVILSLFGKRDWPCRTIQRCKLECLQLPLNRMHFDSPPGNELFQGNHVEKQLLPHFCRRSWEEKKCVRQNRNLIRESFRKTSLSLYQDSEILSWTGRLSV